MAGLPRLKSPDQLRGVKLKVKTVDVPEWATDEAPEGFEVDISELTGEEIGALRQAMLKKDRSGIWRADPNRMQRYNAMLLVESLRDNGERIFADEDARLLLKLGASGTERLAAIAKDLSRLNDMFSELEDEEKDSGPTPRPSSNSGSLLIYDEPSGS